MAFLGVPPSDLDLAHEVNGVRITCAYSSAGVSTSIMVRDGNESLLIDVGDGALRDIIDHARSVIPGTFDEKARSRMGSFVEGIKVIALSHDHFDHVGGLLSLLSFLRMVGRRSALTVLAPEGSSLASSLIDLHRNDTGDPGFDVDLIHLHGQGEGEYAGWSIEWIEADHRDVTIDGRIGGPVPAMAYTIRRKGVRIFYTGDTAFSERFPVAAAGCDLAIAEGTYPAGDGKQAHMTVEEASRIVSGAKKGWIVHLTGASKAALDRP